MPAQPAATASDAPDTGASQGPRDSWQCADVGALRGESPPHEGLLTVTEAWPCPCGPCEGLSPPGISEPFTLHSTSSSRLANPGSSSDIRCHLAWSSRGQGPAHDAPLRGIPEQGRHPARPGEPRMPPGAGVQAGGLPLTQRPPRHPAAHRSVGVAGAQPRGPDRRAGAAGTSQDMVRRGFQEKTRHFSVQK